jgi:hypothetical protein
MWRRARLGLILCAFGFHDWAKRRGEAVGWTDDRRGYFHHCRRCGAHQ